MHLLADTHVHFYPPYSTESWVTHALTNLSAHTTRSAPSQAKDFSYAVCWTRSARDIDRETLHERLRIHFSCTEVVPYLVTAVLGERAQTLFIVSGAQHVSQEGVEVLSLGTNETLSGLPLPKILERSLNSAWRVILPWSPGKWLGHRGNLVRDALSAYPALSAGDISLRPDFLGPVVKGSSICAGSDPLPLAGEEAQVGRSASLFEIPLTTPHSESAWRETLSGPALSVGTKNGLIEGIRRWACNFGRAKVKNSVFSPF